MTVVDRFTWAGGSSQVPVPLRAGPMVSEGRYVHSFLSNFFPVKVKWEGIVYPSVEHAFQASKTFNQAHRAGIARLALAGEAKRAGRSVALRQDWEVVKLLVMRALVMQKFTIHDELRLALIDTEQATLVEGNTWGDTFWGKVKGQGDNHLGVIIMDVRDELRVLAGEGLPR